MANYQTSFDYKLGLSVVSFNVYIAVYNRHPNSIYTQAWPVA